MDKPKIEDQPVDSANGQGDKDCKNSPCSQCSEHCDPACEGRDMASSHCEAPVQNAESDISDINLGPKDIISEDVVDKHVPVNIELNDTLSVCGAEDVQSDTSVCASDRGTGKMLSDDARTSVGEERFDSEGDDSNLLISKSFLRDDSVVEFTVDGQDNDSTDEEEQGDILQCLNENNKDISSETETTEENKSLDSLNSDEKMMSLHLLPQETKNSSHLLTEIEDLLTATACSPDSGFEVTKIDVSSTSKENLMKMISSLLDECDTLKKEKTR